MKTLMMTTALVTATAFGAAAQTADTGMNGTSTVPAFVASDFTGKTLHALDPEAVGQIETEEMTADERVRLRWTSSDVFLADRDVWESVGSIDDIVMTQDGEIRGVLVDVGGFLGFGARTVMVDIEEIYFVSDEGEASEIDDFDVVIAMTAEELENLPEWDEDQLRAGFEMRSAPAEHDMGTAGESEAALDTSGDADRSEAALGGDDTVVMGEGFASLDQSELSADRLLGADVYDMAGDNIGTVDDVIIGDDERVSEVIVDVGGFLGMGAHTVALPLDTAQIGWHEEEDEVRVQVSMTAEQLEEMPEYEG